MEKKDHFWSFLSFSVFLFFPFIFFKSFLDLFFRCFHVIFCQIFNFLLIFNPTFDSLFLIEFQLSQFQAELQIVSNFANCQVYFSGLFWSVEIGFICLILELSISQQKIIVWALLWRHLRIAQITLASFETVGNYVKFSTGCSKIRLPSFRPIFFFPIGIQLQISSILSSVSAQFQLSFCSVSAQFQLSFSSVSTQFQLSFSSVSAQFQLSFSSVSAQFQWEIVSNPLQDVPKFVDFCLQLGNWISL